MEYIMLDGSKVLVDGDKVTYVSNDKTLKFDIGPNYTHGVMHGAILSSFDRSFQDENLIIESDIGDIIKSKIGNFNDAYLILQNKLRQKQWYDVNELAVMVCETVDEYFGGISNIDSRLDYYYDFDDPRWKENKISNLKGTGAAMCVERAVLAQNLLAILGIKSFYKSSGIIKDGNNEVHSYNLIEYDGHYYIFDTSIPNLVNGEVNPLIAEINKETFDTLSNPLSNYGVSVSTSHYNPYREKEVSITYDNGREKSVEVQAYGKSKPNVNKK